MPFKSEKQRKWMHANEPEMAKKWEKEEESVDEEKKRDYKAEYKKYGSSTKAKKYRAELNQYNRKKGTYGNGDGKDASHKGGKIVGFENQSVNRGRAEKSRLRKEAIFEDMNDAQLAKGIKHWASKHKGTGIGYGHVLGQLAVHMKEMGWNKSYKEVARIAVELGKKKTVESINEISFSHVSTQKLVKSYKQMADERLSGAAALTFRLIAKELIKRKAKLESVNEKVVKVSKKDDVPGNPMKMSGEEKIKKLAWSASQGTGKPGSYEIKGNKLNVNNVRPRDKGFFVRHFTMKTGFRKANLYYDGVHWQGKKKF